MKIGNWNYKLLIIVNISIYDIEKLTCDFWESRMGLEIIANHIENVMKLIWVFWVNIERTLELGPFICYRI